MEKTCTACSVTKPVELFPRSSFTRGSYFFQCKSCGNARQKKWRDLTPEKKRQYELKKKFGISLSQYNQMFTKQNGCCAICNKHQSEVKKALAVDHDHITGEIRGLLCSNCNVGLGNFQDSLDMLERATNYLNQKTFTGLKVIAGGAN